MPATIVELLSIFMLCGFTGAFIVPEVVISLFYRVPTQIIRYKEKRATGKSLQRVIFDVFMWLAVLVVVYLIVRVSDPPLAVQITVGPVAIFCWILSLGITTVKLASTVVKDRRARQMRRLESIHRMPIGEILVVAGVITEGQLASAVALQKQSGKHLGEVLLDSDILSSNELDNYLEKQEDMKRSLSEVNAENLLLGNILIHSGVISRNQLDRALEYQKKHGTLLGESLIATKCLAEDVLGIVLDIQTLLDLEHFSQRQAQHLIEGIVGSSGKNIGSILLKSGIISRPQLDLVLLEHDETGRRVGDLLVAHGFVSREIMDCIGRIQKFGREGMAALQHVKLRPPLKAGDVGAHDRPKA